ncbi:MAG TPA: SPOR domain-containing protein [Candidatus Brocadiaceae bacterium]
MTKGNESREFFEILKTQPKKADTVQNEEIVPRSEPSGAIPQLPITEEKHVTKPKITGDPLDWIRKTSTSESHSKEKSETPVTGKPFSDTIRAVQTHHKGDVIVRKETLIIGAIAVTFLSVACFFLGHKIGYNNGVLSHDEAWLESVESRESKKSTFAPKAGETAAVKPVQSKIEKPVEKQPEQPKAVTKDTIKDKWTLRVVSYRNTKESMEKAKELAKILQSGLSKAAFVVNTGKELFICMGEFDSNDSADLINTQKALAEFKYENKKQFGGCYPIRMR